MDKALKIKKIIHNYDLLKPNEDKYLANDRLSRKFRYLSIGVANLEKYPHKMLDAFIRMSEELLEVHSQL